MAPVPVINVDENVDEAAGIGDGFRLNVDVARLDPTLVSCSIGMARSGAKRAMKRDRNNAPCPCAWFGSRSAARRVETRRSSVPTNERALKSGASDARRCAALVCKTSSTARRSSRSARRLLPFTLPSVRISSRGLSSACVASKQNFATVLARARRGPSSSSRTGSLKRQAVASSEVSRRGYRALISRRRQVTVCGLSVAKPHSQRPAQGTAWSIRCGNSCMASKTGSCG